MVKTQTVTLPNYILHAPNNTDCSQLHVRYHSRVPVVLLSLMELR